MAALTLAGAPVFLAQALPSITTQPVDRVNITVGAATSFHVVATSSSGGALTYQWRLNGVTLPGATNSTLTFTSVQATNCGAYSVAVNDGTLALNSSVAQLTVSASTALGNDTFLLAYSLPTSTNGFIRSSNVLATADIGEPSHAGQAAVKSIWFKWTAPSNGIVTFTTRGSSFDTVMSIYSPGTVLSRLLLASGAIDDDDGGGFLNSKVSFNATMGAIYNIAVDGKHGASGNVVLNWSEEATTETLATVTDVLLPPHTVAPNGLVSYAAQSAASQFQWYFNNAAIPSAQSSSYRISPVTVANVGAYSVRLTGLNAAGGIGTHFSFSQPAQVQINYHDDGTTDTNALALDKFLDSVAVVSQGLTGFSPSGGSDSRGYSTSQIFNTTEGSKEPGEPNHCGQVGGASAWYTYKPATNDVVRVSTDGSAFNTILAVYIGPGDSFATLTNVGCGYTTNYTANGQPQVYFTGDTKTTYYIVVDGYNGATGPAQLNINNGATVAVAAAPVDQTVWATSNATFAVTAHGAAPITYQWQYAGASIANATNSAYTVTNASAGKAGAYTVIVSNIVSSTNVSANLSLYTPPAVTTDVTNQTAVAGTNVTFLCAASGTAPLSYQWRLGSPGTNFVGATNSSLTLTNVQSANAGSYRCVITNAAGAVTSSIAALTVNIPAAISANPTNVTVIAGNSAVFNCSATGTAPLGYQWRFGGISINGGTASTLTVNNTASTNAGSYDCVVTNMAGSATSSSAALTVNVPPAITTNPAAQIVVAGTNVTFTCQASGTATLSYQWRFAGGNIGGATTTVYTLNNVQTNNAGSYDCVVTNVAGSATSSSAALTVNVPPSITTNPTNQTVLAGTNVIFICQSSGTGPLSYQWRFGGVIVGGATTTALTLNNVQTNNAGSYDCVVTNVAGSVTSSAATLTVNVPPAITSNPTNLTVIAGNSAVFNCQATGTAALIVQWRFGGATLAGATNTSLTLASVQAANAGSYDCVVTNVAGSVTSAVAALTVNVPPTITADPTNQTVGLGNNAVLSCQASGTGPLSYQWQSGVIFLDVANATNSTLNLTNVQLLSAGNYRCIVTNLAGSVTSAVAVLTVTIAPTITLQPASHTVSPGTTAVLSVGATGSPSFQWKFNGANVGVNSSTLTIPNFQSSNEGTYQVVMTNLAGSVSSTGALLLLDAPFRLEQGRLAGKAYQMQLIGAVGSNYVVEISTDLLNWSPLQTNLLTNGFLTITDTNSSSGLRLYRSRVLP